MIDLYIMGFILFSHWVSDFILQTHYMASNKSSNFKVLLSHVGLYSVSMFIMMAVSVFLYGYEFSSLAITLMIMLWAIFNGLLHLGTDFITSRVTSRLYQNKDFHNFFVVIGLDQFLHYIVLFYSWVYIVGV